MTSNLQTLESMRNAIARPGESAPAYGHALSYATYERHRPEQTLLYQLIERYWPEFQAYLSETDGNPGISTRVTLRLDQLEQHLGGAPVSLGALAVGAQPINQLVFVGIKLAGVAALGIRGFAHLALA